MYNIQEELTSMEEEVIDLLSAAVCRCESHPKDALDRLAAARATVDRMYRECWHATHTSGVGLV